MTDLADGEATEMKGSAAQPYVLKNTGGVYSCSCPAWRNQSLGIEKRTCKHLRKLRGDAAEEARVGSAVPLKKETHKKVAADGREEEKEGPPVLLAHTWESHVDLAGWWMSEKLDGVRAYWDGKHFISRLGNRYHAPDWFVAGLPDTPLDGELWGGRKLFQRTISIVRRQDQSADWKKIQYLVFDAPAMKEPFEERLEFARGFLAGAGLPHAAWHEHVQCEGIDHLREELARVEALGGEGLMMRKPRSKYEVGRSSTLLKVKTFHDSEALVLEHLAGAGRHKGRLGALLVEMADGTKFSVGTGFSDVERSAPPPIGGVITFRYQELSDGGVPRFPSFVGVRHDMKWPPDGSVAPVARKRPAAAKLVEATPSASASATAPATATATATATASASASATVGARRFELVEGGASKFWEIEVKASQHTVRFGRIGTAGQEKTKTFSDAGAAARDAAALIAEKLAKGYAAKD